MKHESLGPIRYVIVLLIGTTLTWTTGLADLQYINKHAVGFQHGFPGEVSKWDSAGEQENILITDKGIQITRVHTGRSYAKRTFDLTDTLSEKQDTLRVRAMISTIHKPSADHEGKAAAFMIWFLDEAKKGIKYLTVQTLTGDFREYRAERVVKVPTTAKFAVAVLQNNESSGQFILTNASINFVSVSIVYQYIAAILILFWLALLGFSVYRCYESLNLLPATVLAIIAILILSGVLLPEFAMTGFVLPLLNLVVSYSPININITIQSAYKIGHFVFFFVLSFVLLFKLVSPTLTRIYIVSIILLIAIATEGMQLHLYHRTSRLFDLSIDIAGILLAFLITTILMKIRNYES